MGYLRGVDRSQAILFPASVEEYVEEDSVVRVIDAFVSRLDMKALGFTRAEPARTGRPGYDPRDLVRLYVYGYMNRVRSSRRLEQEAARNVEVMWLLRRLRPDYKTIADFRRDHPEGLKKVYRAFTEFCRKAELLGGTQVSVDGSKFQAANAREKNQTQSGLKQALKASEERIARYLRDLEEADRAEEEGEDLAQKLGRVTQKKAELEALLRQMEEAGQTQRSQTDAESRRMPVRGGGTGVSYNVQVAVDTKHHLIVEYEVTNEGNDLNQLSAMATAAKEALGAEALEVLADRGYYNGEEIAACVEAGITPQVPQTKTSKNEKKGLYTNERFRYDAGQDHYVCPAGQRLVLLRREMHEGRPMGIYANAAACQGCPRAARCHQNQNGRYIRRPPEAALLEQMRKRLKENPELMRVRQKVAEHPFGTIKRAMEQGYFLLRGRRKTRGEFALSALAYNLKRALAVLGARRLLHELRTWEPACAPAALA
jgi:transposase